MMCSLKERELKRERNKYLCLYTILILGAVCLQKPQVLQKKILSLCSCAYTSIYILNFNTWPFCESIHGVRLNFQISVLPLTEVDLVWQWTGSSVNIFPPKRSFPVVQVHLPPAGSCHHSQPCSVLWKGGIVLHFQLPAVTISSRGGRTKQHPPCCLSSLQAQQCPYQSEINITFCKVVCSETAPAVQIVN